MLILNSSGTKNTKAKCTGGKGIYIYIFFFRYFLQGILFLLNENSLKIKLHSIVIRLKWPRFFFFCFFLLKQWLLQNSLFCKRWILLQPIKYKFTEMNFLVANQIQVYNSMNYLTAWQLHWFKKRCRHAFHEDVFQSNLKWLISHMISIIFTYDIHVHLSTL